MHTDPAIHPKRLSDERRGELLITRGHLLWTLRSFFYREGFLEIETPSLVCSPGLEPQLDAFEVNARYAAKSIPARRLLHTSPEYALKRYLGGEGREVQRVYSLGSCFRDELPSTTHSPEFTLLEWYARDLSLEGLMSQCEALIRALAEEGRARGYTPQRLLDDRPYERLSVQEAFIRYAEVDLERCPDVERLRLAAERSGVRRDALHGSWDELYFQIFMDLVEPHLGSERPTFLYDFPASQAALAKLDPERPQWARRFELFAEGLELANAFDELSDPEEQRARFLEDLEVRRQRGAQCPPIDEVLLARLPQLGDCVGIALGFDRLVMSICGVDEIDLVRLQPWESP